MHNTDKLSLAEIIWTVGLILLFALIWMRWPEIKVSSKSLEWYDGSDLHRPSWHNGIGLTVKAQSLNDPASTEEEFERYRWLIEKYQVFAVTVEIEPTSYPTMVDLPYERMKLTDGTAKEFRLVNREVAAKTSDVRLREVLEKFDWSMVNNTFTHQGRKEEGLLLFEPGGAKLGSMVLQLNVYHHAYKQIDLIFRFAQGSQALERRP